MAHRKSCLKLHSKTFWIMIEKAWFPFVGLWCWLSSVVLYPCFCFCLATARPCSGHNTSLSFICYLFVCVPAKQCVSNFTFVSSMKSGYFKQNYKDVSFEQWIPTAVEAATAKDQQYFISLWLRKWRRRWRSTIKICGCPSRKRDGNNSDQHQNTRFCYFYPVSLSIAGRNRETDKRKPIAKTTHWKEPWTQDDNMKWKSRFWCIKSFFCWLKIKFDLDFEQCIGHNSTSSEANGETRSMALVNNAKDLKEFFFSPWMVPKYEDRASGLMFAFEERKKSNTLLTFTIRTILLNGSHLLIWKLKAAKKMRAVFAMGKYPFYWYSLQ